MSARKTKTLRRRALRSPKRPARARTAPVSANRQVASAVEFLEHLEAAVLTEIRSQCAALTGRARRGAPAELSYIADLGHVIAYWHDDSAYLDQAGRPRLLTLKGSGPSLTALIARVYPHRPVRPVIQALLRTGVLRKRGRLFACTSRHVVFPAGIAAYLSGLIPIWGLANTLRSNIAGERKRLQQMVLNTHVPVSELPALYRSIDQRVRPVLEAIDVDMMRRERRVKAGDALARVGLAVQLFDFPPALWPSRAAKRNST